MWAVVFLLFCYCYGSLLSLALGSLSVGCVDGKLMPFSISVYASIIIWHCLAHSEDGAADCDVHFVSYQLYMAYACICYVVSWICSFRNTFFAKGEHHHGVE